MTTSQSYFRVQAGERDVLDLLDPEMQVSNAWHRTDRERPGISVCESRETLAQYLATVGSGIPYGLPGWVLVELIGEPTYGDALDGEYGEVLVRPTEIVSAEPIPADFWDMIGDAYEAAEAA